MEIKLVVVGGIHAGKEIQVRRARFTIGRSKECQLRPGCNLVSRRHCAIVHEDGRLLIEDLGSTNGTFVNDEKVEGPRELSHGDRLGVGTMEFEVRLFENVPDDGEAEADEGSVAGGRTLAGESQNNTAQGEAAAVETRAAVEKKAVAGKQAAPPAKRAAENRTNAKKKGERKAPEHNQAPGDEIDDLDGLIAETDFRRSDPPAKKEKEEAPRPQANPEEDDLDVSSWLDNDLNADFSSAGDGDLAGASDSNLPDTGTMPSSLGTKEEDEDDENDEDEEEDGEVDQKKASGTRASNGSPPPASPAPAVKKDNSRNAASDALGQMYRFMK